MKYILLPEELGVLEARQGAPLDTCLSLSFSEPVDGKLILDGEAFPVSRGRVTLPARALTDGVHRLRLYSRTPTAAQWRVEGLAGREGRVTPQGIDGTALLLKLYEENRKNRQAIEKLTRDALYFGSKIDGGSLF